MTFRNLITFAFLGWVLTFVAILTLDWSAWWLTPLHTLGRYQLFHVVAHFSIFAGVVALYAPHKRNTVWLWIIVVTGAVMVEVIQMTLGNVILTRALLTDSIFDIAVDLAGAATCWIVLTHHRNANLAQSPA